MTRTVVDLGREQAATLARPRRLYGVLARMLFLGMDLFYGKPLTLGKVRLLELLARIPYQAWEARHYRRLDSRFEEDGDVRQSEDIIAWGRAAQDNEFWHLRVITEKIREDGVQLGFFKDRLAPRIAAWKYAVFCRALAFVNIRAAFLLNADFEDHAEHEYMRFVADHPELETQPVTSPAALAAGDSRNWADVFRRIGLDEREHMNSSLRFAGRESEQAPFLAG